MRWDHCELAVRQSSRSTKLHLLAALILALAALVWCSANLFEVNYSEQADNGLPNGRGTTPNASFQAYDKHKPVKRDVPHGIYGQSGRQVTTPLLSDHEYGAFNWSTETSIRESRRGHHVLYNYTLHIDNDGLQQTRWLKREFVPRNRIPKRSYYLDPKSSYTWNPRGHSLRSGCKVVITFCYRNAESRDGLQNIVNEAINRWHGVLTDKRGIDFQIVPSMLCYKYFDPNTGFSVMNSDVEVDTVFIEINYLGIKSATTGYDPIQNPLEGPFPPGYPFGRHSLLFDPRPVKEPNPASIFSDMTHELGHVLGLRHEHQRPDAVQYIDYHCKNVIGYDTLKAWLDEHVQYTDDTHERITMDIVCKDWPLALVFSYQHPERDAPPLFYGSSLMPINMPPDSPRIRYGNDISKQQNSMYSNSFDPFSIMIYGSYSLSNFSGPPSTIGGSRVKWTLSLANVQGEASLITPPEYPSPGDKVSVEAMYPLLPWLSRLYSGL